MSTKLAARPPRERLSSLKRPRSDRNAPSFFSASASASAPTAATAATGAIGRPAVRKACPNPTCSTPDIQEIDGERVCISCGTIINDSNIVAEVTFGESSAGAAVVQGGFVGEGQRHARSLGPGFRRSGGHGESREITEYHGREEIRKLGSAIRVFQAIEDQAFSIYKLAAANNFIQGRRTRSVAAVCLYVACRRDKTNTILLMDLAELIRVNIFKLGEVYKDLMKDLWLGDFSQSGVTPVIEVEPLILKFARKLEFGNQYRKVAEDAVKILKRMKRDWMVTGRRPAGLCGACIILAARMNNYRRTVREVVYVVKVADMTIAKRLEEFERTRSSTLTVEEFRKYGLLLKTQHDPPAMYDAARRKEKKRKLAEMTGRSSESTPDVADASAGSENSQKQPRRDADGFVIPDRPIDPNLLAASNIAHSELQAMGDNVPEDSQSNTPKNTASNKRKQRDEDTHDVNNKTNDKAKKKKKAEPLPLTPQDLLAEEELESEINQIITDPETLRNAAEEAYTATQDHAKALAEQMRGRSAVSTDEEINPDEFADDPEVSNCILSAREISIKERIWVTHNEDWLRAQQAKILKKTLEEASGGGVGAGAAKSGSKNNNKKKQKRSRMGDGSVLEGGDPILTPADANQRMLMKRSKGFSKLINYEKLNKIYEGFVGEIGGGSDRGGGDGQDEGEGEGGSEDNENDDENDAAAATAEEPTRLAQSVASADEPCSNDSRAVSVSPSQATVAAAAAATAAAVSPSLNPPQKPDSDPVIIGIPLPTPPNTQPQPQPHPQLPSGSRNEPTNTTADTTTQPLPHAQTPAYENGIEINRNNKDDRDEIVEVEDIEEDEDDEEEEEEDDEEEEEEEEEEEPDLNQVVDEFGVVRDDDDDDADDDYGEEGIEDGMDGIDGY